MWAVGRYDLRLDEKDFWRLTPAQYFAMAEQLNQKVKREDLRQGYLLSMINNMFQKKSREPSFWFPSLKPDPRKMTPEERELRQRIAMAYLKRGLNSGEKKSRNS